MLIQTTMGMVDDATMEKTELREKVPCGDCVTTTYWLAGMVVRQDVEIVVLKAAFAAGSAADPV